jgi:hypothetical protein
VPKLYEFDAPLLPLQRVPEQTCYSCGNPAAVIVRDKMCCGRCAYLLAGDTVGTIAALLMHLGAGRSFASNASISQVIA